ncbi:NAD-dependent deacylase [Nocardioides pocheonensis]|uniref:NAD-dependent protein deacylase n=1 Tax=Nocardioides pocheonensis TaxID=661485 RepID=A0A3N0GIY2_9ACTN|nr:NAD-dependent deacylase [Nocardioides pocheonensis]RNM12434.1 NAD-dependent deacylase [Nocardioides pocheonensis]
MKVVVLTGAGISAESGLPTFRDSAGLWEGHRPEEVATPEAFAADPDRVLRFYDLRRQTLARVEPNAAHHALARLEEALGPDLFLVTQNVDDLHERAGSRQVHHLHGRLSSAWCRACDARMSWTGTLADRPPCPACGRPELRPDIVWFGEAPYEVDAVHAALHECDLFAAIGTSGTVYPAAAYVHYALAVGARTVDLNLRPSVPSDFDESRVGPASDVVPAWVDELLGGPSTGHVR